MTSELRTTVIDGRPIGLGDVAPRLDRAMTAFIDAAYPGKAPGGAPAGPRLPR